MDADNPGSGRNLGRKSTGSASASQWRDCDLDPGRSALPHSTAGSLSALTNHRCTESASTRRWRFSMYLRAAAFYRPFIWYGLAGLSILVVLAVTSNQVSIRKLGGRNWKRLHRLAYIAAALLIYHQAIAGKGHWHITRWLLFPLAALQAARIAKTLLAKPARVPATNQSPKRVARKTITSGFSADTSMTATNNRPQGII